MFPPFPEVMLFSSLYPHRVTGEFDF